MKLTILVILIVSSSYVTGRGYYEIEFGSKTESSWVCFTDDVISLEKFGQTTKFIQFKVPNDKTVTDGRAEPILDEEILKSLISGFKKGEVLVENDNDGIAVPRTLLKVKEDDDDDWNDDSDKYSGNNQ